MFKKLIIFMILNFVVFLSIGKIIFDKRSNARERLDPFLNSLENEKTKKNNLLT